MKLSQALNLESPISTISVPELRDLRAAAERIRDRWPEVQVTRAEKEREALAQNLRERIERSDWADARLSFVLAAAEAVFDKERRSRADLTGTRDFLYREIAASTSETFLSGMFRTYRESYSPKEAHTVALAKALKKALPQMSMANRQLISAIPEFLHTASGPYSLAKRIAKMADPFIDLQRLGLGNPHSSGFMDHAHLSLTALVRPKLSDRDYIDWYIKWLRPPGKAEGWNAGALPAIEALIHPWLEAIPEDTLRSHLVETLIELYGDPRIRSGGVWGGIDERYLAVVHRWLTREDMRFFTGVVDATQKDAMWPPRRDFWLKLYDEGKIDAAWAALSSQAFEYARQHLMRQDAKNAHTRVGYQRARPNTSLLIMKIGNKIMVDGCHSYRTHVFDIADPMAPKLFEEGYDCDQIMRASDRRASGASKSHSSIPSWSRWVRDMINADVAWSKQTHPYTKIARPSPPKPRYTPSMRHPTSGSAARKASVNSPFGEDLFSFGATTPTTSGKHFSAPIRQDEAQPTDPPPQRHGWYESSKPNTRGADKTSPPKQAHSLSLTERLVAHGPSAAASLLSYLEKPEIGGIGTYLSPKSREGLTWIQGNKGELPLRLKNSLEYLLVRLKKEGVDLDALFLSSSSAVQNLGSTQKAETHLAERVEAESEKYPPLPASGERRLALLYAHIPELEERAMLQNSLEERKALVSAIKQLKTRSPQLRVDQRLDLESLYETLRQEEKGTSK